ncbi:MAG: hypothetical protein D3917_09840 [Candidatus Electrothrix sp. AX5]|nr:hypothetical protein [Candidatus Electrothrix sp. AX5]
MVFTYCSCIVFNKLFFLYNPECEGIVRKPLGEIRIDRGGGRFAFFLADPPAQYRCGLFKCRCRTTPLILH